MSTNGDTKVVQYGMRTRGGEGARMCSFTEGEFHVTVGAHLGGSVEDDARVLAFAQKLANDAAAIERARGEAFAAEERQRARIAGLEAEVAKLRALVPPKHPARLFGPGMARFDFQGALWLLDPVKQWRGMGVRCAGWDDLFRCYAVRVTGHGSDEHGPWWTVENTDERDLGDARPGDPVYLLTNKEP